MSMSSQIGLHVAQTMVSDLLSPKTPCKNLDTNIIIDSLIEQIKKGVKHRFEIDDIC